MNPSEWLSVERLETCGVVWMLSSDYAVRMERWATIDVSISGSAEVFSFILGDEPVYETLGFDPMEKSNDELRRIGCALVHRFYEKENL